MASRRFTREEVERLGELARLRLPKEDLDPLAEALAEHDALVEPLLALELADVDPALTFDPRWRD